MSKASKRPGKIDGIRWLDGASIALALALAAGGGFWMVDKFTPTSGVASASSAVVMLSGPPAAGSCWSIPRIEAIGDPSLLRQVACSPDPSVWRVIEASPCSSVEISADLVVNDKQSKFSFCVVQTSVEPGNS